jgi:BlaI family transcriptional regulator, penicillinase repressor
MNKLTIQEHAAMMALWKVKTGSIHDILKLHAEPKPHKNTLTSTLKNLIKKGLVSFRQVGNAYDYYPTLSKSAYTKFFYKNFLNQFFDNSVEGLVSFIAKDKKLSQDEIEQIQQIINKNKMS